MFWPGFKEGQRFANVVTVRYDVGVADVVLRVSAVDRLEGWLYGVVRVPRSVLVLE